jgi:cytochrome c biogenesis protein
VSTIALGPIGWVRWFWRQLTTMRVALQLLFLLALAAAPGSYFPQRAASPMKVTQYLKDSPDLGAWLDRFGMFDVYGSVWFSSIYILLMISLIGCIIPRVKVHFEAMRGVPPTAPRFLTKLETSTSVAIPSGDPSLVEPVMEYLSRKRWRVRTDQDEFGTYIAAERGYLRETGNLIFHIAIVFILIAVAAGSMFGWRGQVVIRENTSMTNELSQYDTFTPGRLFSLGQLEPFTVQLDRLEVRYEESGMQIGAARDYKATVTYRESAKEPEQTRIIGVNDPLNVGNASMFLVGHGYAPHFRVTDSHGNVVFDDAVIFLPQDSNFTSTGVVKVPDADPQLGFNGIFAPTGVVTEDRGPHSLFPQLIDPQVFLSAWTGDLGLDNGIAQNVYRIDTTHLKKLGLEELEPGETWKLPQGKGSITFVGVVQFATFNVASDPGQNWALFGAILAILGVIAGLYVQRRRLWIRIVDGNAEIAVLSRYEDARLSEVLEEMKFLCEKTLGVEQSAADERASDGS